MPSSFLSVLSDSDELNRHLDADPALAENMREMGFVMRLPFQLDHNGATVSKWAWTDYGRREMLARLNSGLEFQLQRGQESKQ